MGLLDDAIREHLDLKRRRGADPAEVARAEQEALGPVRRDPVPADAADEHHEHEDEHAPTAVEPPAAAEPHTQTHNDPHPADEGLHPDDATHVLAPEDRHEPPHGDPFHDAGAELGGAAAPAAPEPEHDDRAGGAGEAVPAAPPAGTRPPSTGPARSSADPEDEPHEQEHEQDLRHSDIVHQPTTEFHVEDHHDDEDEDAQPEARRDRRQPADEDVLEETPEFLQETPEHDRLWFEQRPPRDFDFDG
jgi:hypothetical protein